jgi:uncharacterized membrane protein YbhN (UPF0104 family)
MAERRRPVGRHVRIAVRLAASLALLLVVFTKVDAGELAARLMGMEPGWILAALAVSVGQVALSAWRWRFTAARLGVRLPFVVALREYYLATFLNQVLPGGVAGDASRAWRHARTLPRRTSESDVDETAGADVPPRKRTVVAAVVLERASGQVVMTFAAWVSGLMLLPDSWGVARIGLLGAGLATGAGAAALLVRAGQGEAGMRGHGGDLGVPVSFAAQTRWALLAREALPAQLGSSALVVASYLAVFLMGARAVGVSTPALTLLSLAAPVLMTMLVPVTVAGWGLREAAAAALWPLAGLTAADGVVISASYGLLVLLSSLPGALVLLRDPPAAPSVAGGEAAYSTAGAVRPAAERAGAASDAFELEVEEDVVAEPEMPAGGAQGLA